MLLTIVKYGDPILRRRALPIKTIDDKVRALAGDMIETMVAAGGCGLAGPQVGEDLRIFVVAELPGNCFSFIDILRAPDCFSHQHPFALINPEIKTSGKLVSGPEGCLSLPGMTKNVSRPVNVKVKALLVNGQAVNFWAAGLLGRIIQHEYDHLEGKLIVDYKR